ncbi:hypothetical protein SEA_SPEEDDEMON_1480 [Gordonia phage SpeedDemon]|nr:hypothetical protein SEA_SPEEDDEMON_1480 [Gordonia phage SpeedDemon]
MSRFIIGRKGDQIIMQRTETAEVAVSDTDLRALLATIGGYTWDRVRSMSLGQVLDALDDSYVDRDGIADEIDSLVDAAGTNVDCGIMFRRADGERIGR